MTYSLHLSVNQLHTHKNRLPQSYKNLPGSWAQVCWWARRGVGGRKWAGRRRAR